MRYYLSRVMVFRVAFVALWVMATTVPLMLFHGWHTVPLPHDDRVDRGHFITGDAGNWQKRHVLLSGCPCSNRVGRWLLQRRMQKHQIDLSREIDRSREIVVLVGGSPAEADLWIQQGWAVELMTENDMWQDYGLAGGPWLLIHHDQQLLYRGGHAPRRPAAATALRDDMVLRRLQNGEAIDPYPAYGCTFTPEFRADDGPLFSSIRFIQ